ncbi:OmpH family outer membrane protein [Pseudodesulfovibrio senegalensis]|jgi:outer membrane protein|uniref:OmpH family outer membrane protein n=1 Tax=Pseudodesulfovibrio senegalensis TaxID=1721087 RepID=A0A6N6N7J8_9BACT|nr:OmpH family outer membrane protein [Pseudodesulfovibrio senegalensis]KAB1443681.1 OmpH family outer membrane protein [Pseudodesulfovibrio senegalensis]
MRKIIFIAIAATLLFSATAFAASKIAVVNVPQVLGTSQPAMEVKAQLEASVKKYQDILRAKAVEIRDLQAKREKQKKILKPEALESMDKDIREKAFKYKESQKEYDAKLKEQQAELKRPMYVMLEKVIDSYAAKNGYDIVVNEVPGVLYVSKNNDITAAVIQEFNKAWKTKK